MDKAIEETETATTENNRATGTIGTDTDNEIDNDPMASHT